MYPIISFYQKITISSPQALGFDILVLKFSQTGELLWQSAFGGPGGGSFGKVPYVVCIKNSISLI
jgi:hypothetical protein